MDSDGHPLSGAIVTDVQSYLDPIAGAGKGRAPIGHAVTVQTPTVVNINVVATVAFKDGYSLDGTGSGPVALRARITQAVQDYLTSLEPGEDVIYNHVLASFFQVEGVLNVSGLTVNGGTSNIAIDPAVPQVAVPNTITLS
jgi:uncharacterized phage protein gp47/JayE